jgi:ribosomal protein S12 methylthiotransferase
MRFERMGAFAYSHEEGTYAYRHYKDDTPEEVKQERLQELMAVQQDIAEAQQQQLVGQTLPVLIDRQEGDWFIGRTEHDSPEVDNEVLIENTYPLKVGRFYPVTITQAEAFDLYGQPQDIPPGKRF